MFLHRTANRCRRILTALIASCCRKMMEYRFLLKSTNLYQLFVHLLSSCIQIHGQVATHNCKTVRQQNRDHSYRHRPKCSTLLVHKQVESSPRRRTRASKSSLWHLLRHRSGTLNLYTDHIVIPIITQSIREVSLLPHINHSPMEEVTPKNITLFTTVASLASVT